MEENLDSLYKKLVRQKKYLSVSGFILTILTFALISTLIILPGDEVFSFYSRVYVILLLLIAILVFTVLLDVIAFQMELYERNKKNNK